MWCIVKMEYYFDEELKGTSPFRIESVTPIQMPNMDLEEMFEQRRY